MSDTLDSLSYENNIDNQKINLTLYTNIIPYEQEKKITSILLSSKYPYSDISNDTIQKVKKINKNISLDLLNSMKNSTIRNNMIIQYSSLIANNTIISEEYSNTNVLNLSKKYNASPINIIRAVFIHRGLNKNEIRKLFFDNERMNEYDKKQFKLALKYDNYGFVDEKKILENSILFEKNIENILIKNNIIFKTQQQLTIEQNKNGNVYSTPDFLILSNLYINNQKVNWIDAKNYYGSFNNFVVKKIKKQTEKYIKLYGKGCIIFNYGFCSKIKFDDIVCFNLNF